MRKTKVQRGQAILEYILLVVMLAVTLAVVIRNTNRTIYRYWTGLANVIALPCPDCTAPQAAPDLTGDEGDTGGGGAVN
jgi:Flp pilus assembly pilin Flp